MTTFERRLQKVEDALQVRTRPDLASLLRQAIATRLHGLTPRRHGGKGPLAERLQRAHARASRS